MPSTSKEILIAILMGVVISFIIIFFLIFFFVLYIKRKEKYNKDILILQSSFQQELLKTQLEIQEQTFKNISQEIHDNIGQALSFVKLNLNTVDAYNPEDTIEKLLESKILLTKTIQDLRDLSKTLNTDFIQEIGLSAAIEQQLFFLKKTGLYVTSFRVSETVYKNTAQTEIVLYRIVQELLNNIIKHAEASIIEIYMDYQFDKLTITVKDNGKGTLQSLNPGEKNHSGLGLQNMLNRMAMIHGFISVNSMPGKGTTALIELPKQTL